MNQIQIKADGRMEKEGGAINGDPLKYLNHQAILADDFTLRSYFHLVSAYPVLQSLNEFFPVILDQYGRCAENGCEQPELVGMAFIKMVEMIGFPSDPRLEIYNAVKAIAGGDAGGGTGGDSLPIKPYPLSTLLDMPLKLGKVKHIVFGDSVDVFEFDTIFSLFEFIDGVAWELSFLATTDQCALRGQ